MLYKRETKHVNIMGSNIPEPRVLLDFLGFEKHVTQIRAKRGASIWPGWFDHAAYYVVDLPSEKLFGHGETVNLPDFVKAPDYEFELGCLVLEKGMPKTMKEAIAFFKNNCLLTILNDWSARDIQKKDLEGLGPTNSKFVIGKSIGPRFIDLKNIDIDDHGVMNLAMKLTVNGEVRSESNYNTIYHTHPTSGAKGAWSFPRIFTFLASQNIALEPGYLFGSGTVGNGCIAEFMAKVDPATNAILEPAKYDWLKEGDTVSMEVEHIGTLENKVHIVSTQLATV